MNDLKPIQNCELVEIKIGNTTNARWNFPISENLKGKKIVAIETFQVAKVAVAPSSNAVINATAFKNALLTLQFEGKEKVKDIPLVAFEASSNNGLIKQFDAYKIDMQKSYVSFTTQTGVVANESIIFVFYYLD